MKAFVGLLAAMFFATTCLAQGNVGSNSLVMMDDGPDRSIQSYTRVVEGRGPFFAAHDTPTMQRQRLARALALRSEAEQLLLEDGGTLTAKHEHYLRRAANKILSASR